MKRQSKDTVRISKRLQLPSWGGHLSHPAPTALTVTEASASWEDRRLGNGSPANVAKNEMELLQPNIEAKQLQLVTE